MKLASLINLKSLKEEYSSEYIEGDKVKFNPLLMKDRGFEDNLEYYDDLTGVVTKASQGELEVKLSKSIIPPGGGNIDGILLMKSEGDYEMIEKVEPGAFWDVQSGGGLKEGSMQARELADIYTLQQLQAMRDEIMMDMENDPSVEPEGGEVADQYGDQLNDIDAAIELLSPKRTPLTYDQAIGRVSRDEFEKSSKFDRMNETTEKAWNAIDVSRKAEKEISNKEWNERTGKKLDILKALNAAGKFKKDFDDERLQGWVDQNYSWEKLSRQFKLNESYSEMYNEMKVTDKDGKDVTSDVIKSLEKSLKKSGYTIGKTYTSDPELYGDDPNVVGHSEKPKKEGSCGYGPDGVPGDTPGDTQGMEANDRTRGMLRKLIQKEIAKLSNEIK